MRIPLDCGICNVQYVSRECKRERATKMQIEKTSRYEIWAIREDYGMDYYVYSIGCVKLYRVCPSIGMAREIAAGV